MSRDNGDALIDQLLREILGGDRPRDITARVMAQAKIYDRFRKRRWMGAGLALAASVGIVAGLMVFWPRAYPNPQADENVYVVNGGDFQRGQALATDDENSGSITLGGYAYVKLAPQTNLTIGGDKNQEKVLLDNGQLDVEVAKDKGNFEVAVGPATVQGSGSKFGVDVRDGLDETQTRRVKMMYVNVKEGRANVRGVDSPTTITSGNTGSFVISSEPVKVIKAMATAAREQAIQNAAGRGRQGLQEGMLQGAREGMRGAAGRVGLANGPLRAQIVQRLGLQSVVAGDTKPVLFVTTERQFERIGMLRESHGIYYLETTDNSYLMFPTGAALAGWQPVTDRPIHVTWQAGKVTGVVPEAAK